MHRGFVIVLTLLLLAPLVVLPPLTRSQQDDADAGYEALLEWAVGSEDEPGDIDRFWRGIFSRLDDAPEYRTPDRIVAYDADRLPESACQPDYLGNAFYCSADGMLAWDDDWLRVLSQAFLESADGVEFPQLFRFAPLIILAHEWGHHIQSLFGRGVTGLASELQADCYASFYLHDEAVRATLGMTDEQFAAASVQLFRFGNQAFSQSSWFDPAEHGPPVMRWTALQAGGTTALLNSMLEVNDSSDWVADLSYCRDFEVENFEPMRAVHVGPFAVNEFANSTTLMNENGSVDLVHPAATTRLTYLPGLVFGTPSRYFDRVLDSTFEADGSGTLRRIGEPESARNPGGRTQLYQAYEHEVTNSTGTTLTHGIVALDVVPGVGGLLTDVSRNGPAPGDGSDWAPFLAHLAAVLGATCIPDELGIGPCTFSELSWMDLPDVTVRLTLQGFTGDPWLEPLDPGPTLFTFVNDFTAAYDGGDDLPIAVAFALVQLSDSLDLAAMRPPSDTPSGRRAATPDWFYSATMIGGPAMDVFGQTQAVIDLTPGEWVVVGSPFMTPISPPFTVRETAAAPEASAPSVDANIVLSEDGASRFDTVRPGHQLWRVSNQGSGPHELIVYRFPSNATQEQIIAWARFQSSPLGTEPPDDLGFDPYDPYPNPVVAAMSSGQSVVIEVENLPPGTYAAFCWVPDQHSDASHWEMGEVTVFTVGALLQFDERNPPPPQPERPAR